MSALAVATSRITLGTLVLGVMYRNPALTAKMAAMVDHISGGRLFLGMGAAWYKEEHEGLGIDFPSPGERVRRENESLELIRRLWTEDFVDHQGRYYWTKAGQIDPKPTQTPYPPILVGARGDNGLKVTARHADAHNTARDVEGIGEIHGRLRAACEAVGRDYDSIEKTAIALQAVSPTAEGVEAKKKGLEGMFSAPFASMQNRVLHGAVEEVVEQVQRYVDAGITHFMFSQFAPYDLDGLKLMAEKVIPRFR
jgi:alkanesulfonate monooxygenase SsuD/methylene tetrahydromethanopterin reductase-like flavin-dependent oxidoreductase (luciferase family)